MNPKYFNFVILAVVVIILYGCASSDGSRERRDRNLITQEEIESANASNMYDVIDRLRPRWLVARSPMRSFAGDTDILVFQDDVRLGNLEVLRRISPESIKEARYLDASTASSTLPGISRGQHLAGAILLTSTTRR